MTTSASFNKNVEAVLRLNPLAHQSLQTTMPAGEKKGAGHLADAQDAGVQGGGSVVLSTALYDG